MRWVLEGRPWKSTRPHNTPFLKLPLVRFLELVLLFESSSSNVTLVVVDAEPYVSPATSSYEPYAPPLPEKKPERPPGMSSTRALLVSDSITLVSSVLAARSRFPPSSSPGDSAASSSSAQAAAANGQTAAGDGARPGLPFWAGNPYSRTTLPNLCWTLSLMRETRQRAP